MKQHHSRPHMVSALAELNGRRVSRVTFTMRAVYDDWTRPAALQRAFSDELGHTAPASQTIPLELTNDGWVVVTDLPLAAQQYEP